MSKRRIRGAGRVPEYWEWTCDYCGKRANTNSQATRPPGWVPRGRTIGTSHDFCSAEHETAYNESKKAEAAQKAEGPDQKTKAPETQEGTAE